MKRLLACSVGLYWLCSPAGCLEVPYLAGRVNDLAELLSEPGRQRLEERLAQLEQATGAQMAVLTLPSLEGENLEEYSHRVATTWRLGQRDKDNGVLFLIARDDRKMRLEVGYGLEAVLPDLTCQRILDKLVRPRFRAGDFDGGVEAGVDAIAQLLQGGHLPAEVSAASGDGESPPWWAILAFAPAFLGVIGTFSAVALFGTGCQCWFLYLFLLPFWTAFPAGFIHPAVGTVTGLGWLLLFPIFKFWYHKTPAGQKFRERYPGLGRFATSAMSRGGGFSGGGTSFRSGGSSFRSGGSSFRGGGGSFGGGGRLLPW